jgi:hypothetical protein
MGLYHEPHKSQMKNKMVKGKMNGRGHANDVNVIHNRRKNTRTKNHRKTPQCMKMG